MLQLGLSSDFGGAFRCFWDPTPSSAHTGELGLIVKGRFARQLSRMTLAEAGRRGRHATLVCTGPLGTLHIKGAHLDHAWAGGRRDEMQRMASCVRRHPLAHRVWGRDMSFTIDAADRVAPLQPPAEGVLCGLDAAVVRQSLFAIPSATGGALSA